MIRKASSQIVLSASLIILLFGLGFGIGTLIAKHKNDRYRKFEITLCATSDLHGAYFDSTYDGGANPVSLANVASYLKELRAQKKNVILIDNGDNLQGDDAAYYYNYVATEKKHVFSKIAEYLKYDAIVVGNHDLEAGHSVYDRLSKDVSIPYLAANALCSSGKKEGKPYFKPYTIVRRGKLKVAIIGMTNSNTGNWIHADKISGMNLVRISEIAQNWIDIVREKEKPHLVVLAVHSGTLTQRKEMKPDMENEALYLANNLKGVDIVFCGHDHISCQTLVDKGGDSTVALLNPGANAQYVAQCDVQLVLEKNKVAASCFTNHLVEMRNYQPDPSFCEKFSPEFEEVSQYANKIIGELANDISFDESFKGPSAYLDLIHSVQLSKTGADISFSAPLNSEGVLEAGKLKRRDMFEIYRFENTLNSVWMTGKQIKDYLEYSYDLWVENKGASFNYDSASGIEYSVSISSPYGERVRIESLSSGEKFQLDRQYLVAINSYRSSGGGGHLKSGAGIDPSELKIEKTFGDIRNLITEYIENKGVIEPKIIGNWQFVQ